jgi:hypothetical protein
METYVIDMYNVFVYISNWYMFFLFQVGIPFDLKEAIGGLSLLWRKVQVCHAADDENCNLLIICYVPDNEAGCAEKSHSRPEAVTLERPTGKVGFRLVSGILALVGRGEAPTIPIMDMLGLLCLNH